VKSTPGRLRVEELIERASLSRLLGQLYRKELDSPLVAGLNGAGVFEHLESNGFKLDADRLEDGAYLKELGREYTRLFIGPGPHLALYGSVHHPDDPRQGQLWGQTTKEVHRLAKDHGLGFEGPAYDGIPDHLGHMFELMGRLLLAELDAVSAGDEVLAERLKSSQRVLVERYLMPWVPTFCRKVRTRAESSFYGEIARLTDEFLQGEHELLTN